MDKKRLEDECAMLTVLSGSETLTITLFLILDIINMSETNGPQFSSIKRPHGLIDSESPVDVHRLCGLIICSWRTHSFWREASAHVHNYLCPLAHN